MNHQRIKILLTGHSGYLGRSLYESLKSVEFYDLYILSRNCIKCGCNNCIELNELKNYNFDYVINCIGETRVIEKMYNVNRDICIDLFKNINLVTLKKFIHFSTVAVYEQDTSGEINVNSKIKIDSDYASSKYEFDLFLLRQKEFEEKIVIIRPSNVLDNILPGKILFKLSKFRVRFYSMSERYINWCPSNLLTDLTFDILQNKKMQNIFIANKFYELNIFYKSFLSKIYIFYIPVEFLYFILKIFNLKNKTKKFKQLFPKSYFKS